MEKSTVIRSEGNFVAIRVPDEVVRRICPFIRDMLSREQLSTKKCEHIAQGILKMMGFFQP